MGRLEIIEKLDNFLKKHNPINEECEVVYLMVEIRKIIEHERSQSKYPILFFYCNWIAHTSITRKPSDEIKDILERVASQLKTGTLGSEDLGFINFSHLGMELKTFMKNHELSDDTISDWDKWKSFKNVLRDVLINCPIEYQTPPIESFKYVLPSKPDTDIDWKIKIHGMSECGGSMTEIHWKSKKISET